MSAATIPTVTTKLLAAFSRRRPANIRAEDFAKWLDSATQVNTLAVLLRPYLPDEMEAFRVTNAINRHGWDAPHGPECIAPAVDT